MSKVLVEIYLPAARNSFDIYLPLDEKLSTVLPVVSSLLEDLSQGTFKSTAQTVLCNKETGIIYNINLSIHELQLMNGSKLMLI
jgi:hypothetical protein